MTDTTESTTVTPEDVETDGGTQDPPIGEGVEQIDAPDDVEAQEPEQEPETFPREYVERLRKEAADARVKAKDRDDLARRLHVALAAADGRLVAPDELPFDEVHLSDPDALAAAIGALVEKKPYLAARRLRGDIGQGGRRGTEGVDLAGILRSRA